MKCKNCGKDLAEDFLVCPYCGKETGCKETAAVAETTAPAPKKKSKKILIAGVVVVVLAVIAAGVFTLMNKGNTAKVNDESKDIFYISGNQIFYTTPTTKEPVQITEGLNKDGVSEDEYYYTDKADYLDYCKVCKGGKAVLYPDKNYSEDLGTNLYYRSIGDLESAPQKIATNISIYDYDDKTGEIYYVSSEEGILYECNVEGGTTEKIASDVNFVQVLQGENKISYSDYNGNVYTKLKGDRAKLIASNTEECKTLDGEVATFYYIKDGQLYAQKEDGEKENLASSVSSIGEISDAGEFYYSTFKKHELTLMDYVEDDMAENDSQYDIPEMPEDIDRTAYYYQDEDGTEYFNQEGYDKDYSVYLDRLMEYWDFDAEHSDVIRREQLRKELQGETVETTDYELFYFDGKESLSVTKNFSYIAAENADANTICFETFTRNDDDKLYLSEIKSAEEVYLKYEGQEGTNHTFVAVKNNLYEVKDENMSDFALSDDGSKLFFIRNIEEEIDSQDLVKGELCEIAINSDGLGETKIIDTKVSKFTYSEEADVMFYLSDYNYDRKDGCLNEYVKDESKMIEEAVSDFDIVAGGGVAYICNFNVDRGEGDFGIYTKGEKKNVDSDVVKFKIAK